MIEEKKVEETGEEKKIVVCKDCNKEFYLTPGEQEFYKSMGWDEPKRCFNCRKEKKRRNEGAGDTKAMKSTHN